MKNCIIIHGGPLSDVEENPHRLNLLYWQPWVKDVLENVGIACTVPAMPNPWSPTYEAWKAELEQNDIHDRTILVGHSRGAAFLVRWLGETKRIIDKLILVAPTLGAGSKSQALQDFYSFTIDASIRNHISECIIFSSENDDQENIESAQVLAGILAGKIVNLLRHGHYITEDMDGNEFPELVEQILE
jgi:predicted alpha/beta hydrolase family esterase